MMDEKAFRDALQDLPLGDLRYFERTGSTNDIALAWAAEGAPDFSLIIADEQTTGRGRAGRSWYTPPGAALAFSLILRPETGEKASPSLYTGLGALGIVHALREHHALQAQIKWPNDLLLQGHKFAGILVEAVWLGEQIESLVVGIGVNVHAQSTPPPETVDFPATSLEEALQQRLDRARLLRNILSAILEWRARMDEPAFIQAWEDSLAYRGERVLVQQGPTTLSGHLLGLEADGALRLRSPQNAPLSVHFGDVHLRPDKVE